MKRWVWSYFRQRVPSLAYLLIAAGLAFSGIVIGRGAFDPASFVFSFFGLFLCFILLRLIDDVLDVREDKLAHPERPFPQRLATLSEGDQVIRIVMWGMVAYAILLAVDGYWTAAGIYALTLGDCRLIYCQYYRGEKLARHPFWHRILDQLVFIPIILFTIAIGYPAAIFSLQTLFFLMSIGGAFFAYSICRHLDPYSHPILITHLQFYGYQRTFLFVTAGLLISATGTAGMGLQSILWVCDFSLFVAMFVPLISSTHYRVPELAALLSLFAHAWMGIVLI